MCDDDHDYWMDLETGQLGRLEHDDLRAAGPWYELGERVRSTQLDEPTELDTPENIEARIRELRGCVDNWKAGDLPLYDPGCALRGLWAAFYRQLWEVPSCPTFPAWQDILTAFVGNDEESRETMILDLVHRCRQALNLAEQILGENTRNNDNVDDQVGDAGGSRKSNVREVRDVPGTHRYGGKAEGNPLTLAEIRSRYGFDGSRVSKCLCKARHPDKFRIKKGQKAQYVYEWSEVVVLAENKRE